MAPTRATWETYPYVTRLEYDHFGQRRYLQQGNGIVTHYGYEADTRRLASMDASDFQRLRYGYDRVGNVRSLLNDIQGTLGAGQRGGRVEQSFTYDDLHRLATASGTWTEPGGARNSYTLDLSYDAIHNVTRKAQNHVVSRNGNGHPVPQRRTSYDWTYTYGGAQPHAPTAVGEQSFAFDASGRMVARRQQGMGAPGRTLVWDSEDRIRAIQDGGAAVVDEQGNVEAGRGRTTEFVYDAEGNRVVKSGAQGHTAYVNAHYTLRNETVATKHVFIGASRISSKIVPGQQAALPVDTDDVSHMLGRWWLHRSENGWEHARNTEQNPHYRQPTQMPSPMGLPESNFLYFYHSDHLGSTSYVTDGGGEIYEHVQYFPHGEVWADERNNTERLPYLFTGKELDQETGLYDFGARMYDPRTAIWVSPDPLSIVDLDRSGNTRYEHPSHLSMYSQSSNSPLVYIDPDGRDSRRFTLRWEPRFSLGRPIRVGYRLSIAPSGHQQPTAEVSALMRMRAAGVQIDEAEITGIYSSSANASAFYRGLTSTARALGDALGIAQVTHDSHPRLSNIYRAIDPESVVRDLALDEWTERAIAEAEVSGARLSEPRLITGDSPASLTLESPEAFVTRRGQAAGDAINNATFSLGVELSLSLEVTF